jgi:hypothetical protein
MPSIQTQTEPPVIVLVERACSGDHDPALAEIAGAAGDARIHLVAPARALAGEEWLIDRSARERDAYERLAGWSVALAPHAPGVTVARPARLAFRLAVRALA